MKTCRTVSALRHHLAPLKLAGSTVALVPTMGALHRGHLELVARARRRCDVVVVSIFVNPLQFGQGEDFESYPRQLRADAALLEEAGASVLFAPKAESFYSPSHQTTVFNSAVQSLYCGAYRPGHFAGVLTVVAKLFHAASPDEAYFGNKDFQQAWLINKMVTDLNWPIAIRKIPTVRSGDGLALSSRNSYLSPEQRAAAPVIYASLVEIQKEVKEGKKVVGPLLSRATKRIEKAGGKVQYLQIASQESLLPLKKIDRPAVVLVAAFFGKTRLIDNLLLKID